MTADDTWAARFAAAPTAAAAKIQAFSDANRLYQSTSRTAGDALARVVDDAARVAVLIGREAAAAVVLAFDSAVARLRKLPDLAAHPRTLAGVAAYAGVARAVGQPIAGVAPLDPRAPLDARTALAAFGVAAEAVPAEVVAALDALDVAPIVRHLDARPGYLDVLGIAAALHALATARGFELAEPTAWLARALRGDVTVPVPGPARRAREAYAARAPALFAAGPIRDATDVAWTAIELDTRHGLWPGLVVTITAAGDLTVVETQGFTHAAPPRRARLADPARAALIALVAAHDPRTIAIAPRAGVPDEGTTTLTLHGASPVVVRAWASERHADLDALVRGVLDLARVLLATPDIVER